MRARPRLGSYVLLLSLRSAVAWAQPDAGGGSELAVDGTLTTRDAGAGQDLAERAPAMKPPVWLDPQPAPWPAEAALEDSPRVVPVLVTIDASGAVADAVVLDASTGPFAAPARSFALQQRFTPATHAGHAVPARIQVAVEFAPARPSAPAPVTTALAPVPRPSTAPSSPAPALGGDYGAIAALDAGVAAARSVSTSDLTIDIGALHDVPRMDAMQLVTLAPGVLLTNHSGEGHAYTTFLRGFSAGEGQDLEVRVQGVPINEPSNAHGHGYADTHFLIPSLVRTVRVLQGPFDARQGDFAAAGTAEFSLAAREAGVHARAGVGSFGRRQGLLSWSPGHASRDTFMAVELTDGDGFGPNRGHHNVRALAQFAGHARRLDYRFFVASHALRFDSVGVIREDALRGRELQCGGQSVAAFYCFSDPNQGGQATRHLVSSELRGKHAGAEWALGASWMVRTNRFRENFTGALLDPRGDGLDQQTRTNTLLSRGHYRVAHSLGEREQTLELGYEGRIDLGTASMWRLRREGQVPYASVFDHELALSRISVYALSELSFAEWLTAEVGMRADSYSYDVLDRDRPMRDLEGERLGRQSASAWGTNYQPRATLTLGPIATLAWINSFGIGSRSSDATALSEGELAPFTRIWAGESGLVSAAQRRRASYDARAAFFYAYVDRDMVFDETRGRNVPVGATNRYGAYTRVRVEASDRLDGSASFSWAEAYQASDGPGFAAGARVPFVPRFVVRGDLAVSQPMEVRSERLDVRFATGLSWVGPRPLPLEVRSQYILSLDASVRARYRMFELALECINLTDRQNRSAEYFYASDFGTSGTSQRRVRHFSAGPPRTFMASLAVQFDLKSLPKDNP